MGKILIVDNQFSVRTLLVSIFQDDGHEVKVATNGEAALRLLIPFSFEPDVILLNMRMQGMNGIQTLEEIRCLDHRVTVIMMTGGNDPQNMEQAKRLGILCYIAKPFDLFELRERVNEILNSSGISTNGTTVTVGI